MHAIYQLHKELGEKLAKQEEERFEKSGLSREEFNLENFITLLQSEPMEMHGRKTQLINFNDPCCDLALALFPKEVSREKKKKNADMKLFRFTRKT